MGKMRNAKFKIGQVVRHRLFPFRGVVFDIDPEFNNTEEWYQSIPAEVRPHKDQPFYHLFAENAESEYIAYVSEQNLCWDRLVPLLGIVELRIDVEHDTAKRKQAVTNDLADLELGVAHFTHAQTDIVQDCGIRQRVKGCNAPPPPDPWPQPGGRDRQPLWPASKWHRPASCRRS